MKSNLPPLPKEAYDGESYTADIPKDRPLLRTCKHKDSTYNKEKAEIRCACGAAWTGTNLDKLHSALRSQ